MIVLSQGNNTIYLDNTIGATANDSYTFAFSTDIGDNDTTITLTSSFTNVRYIKFSLELTTKELEDLNNGKIYLTSGLKELSITELNYTNIVKVNSENESILEYGENENKYVY